MNNILSIAKDYLLNSDSEISFYEVLNHLNELGYTLSEFEVNEVFKLVNDIALEISMVRSMKFWWETKKHNRLMYGI